LGWCLALLLFWAQDVPSKTTIRQTSDRLVLNWDSFSIPQGHTVEFIQPSDGVALNRVIGRDPSVINDSLLANGQVWILNPNGIVFGPTAHVDVGGRVASTLSISDADFYSGAWRLTQDPSAALSYVVNQGYIKGGLVVVAAPLVENAGVIESPGGRIYLWAARDVDLNSFTMGKANSRHVQVIQRSAPRIAEALVREAR
jgi:filamentous hemagglutinin family protein